MTMNLLDVNVAPAGIRFIDPGIRSNRDPVTRHGECVAYVIASTKSATVESAPDIGDVCIIFHGVQNQVAAPEISTAREIWDPFGHLDVESDICEEGAGSDSELSAFLDRVYYLQRTEKVDHAIDVIFEYLNKLLVDGQFDICDRVLTKVDLARIPPVLMVSFLTITAAAKAKLKKRGRFFNDVRQVVARERGEQTADRLLDGLD